MKTFRLRAQQITVDLPKVDSEPWVEVIVQRIRVDASGKETRMMDRWGVINKKLSMVAMEVYPYYEAVPVPNKETHISVYGLSDAIKQAALHWIAEKYGGTIDGENVYITA